MIYRILQVMFINKKDATACYKLEFVSSNPERTKDLMQGHVAEGSEIIGKRVADARAIQSQRLSRTQIFCNAQMSSRHIKKHCQVDEASCRLLESAIDKLGLSARAYNRILKIARTIADLEKSADVSVTHISEAIQYRNLDRGKQFT